MTYIVIEIQENEDGSVANIVNAYWEGTDEENRADAESKYHDILSVAPKSPIWYHSAVMMKAEGGSYMKNEGYMKPTKEVTVEPA